MTAIMIVVFGVTKIMELTIGEMNTVTALNITIHATNGTTKDRILGRTKMNEADEFVVLTVEDGYIIETCLDVLTRAQAINYAMGVVQELYEMNMVAWEGRKHNCEAVCLRTAEAVEKNDLLQRQARIHRLQPVDLKYPAVLTILPLRRPQLEKERNDNE